MKKYSLLLLVVIVIGLSGCYNKNLPVDKATISSIPNIKQTENTTLATSTVSTSIPNTQVTTSTNINIINLSVQADDLIKSPLLISGQARGPWFFEASFPIKLLDASGKLIASGIAQAKADWMTEDYVPFGSAIEFKAAKAGDGFLVFENDNPSGLPEYHQEFRIPVRLEAAPEMRRLKLYYYDPSKDRDLQGNILCSAKGLVAVERELPLSETPIKDAIELLIQGQISDQEKAEGLTTEYPLKGFEFKGAALNNGALKLSFTDPKFQSSGGACRSAVLWAQIDKTARQFGGVSSVSFSPEDIFQP